MSAASTTHRWEFGEVIVRREVLSRHGVWLGMPVIVVEDTDDWLVTYISSEAPMSFPDGDWPIEGGVHPWSLGTGVWESHGTLMVQRPGERYAVWHFWDGLDRTFSCWYLNLQEPFRRTAVGYDTQDLELDYIVFPDGSWVQKDRELLDVRLTEGRFTTGEVDAILTTGAEIEEVLHTGDSWWDTRWCEWEPDPTWETPSLPEGWNDPPFRVEELTIRPS